MSELNRQMERVLIEAPDGKLSWMPKEAALANQQSGQQNWSEEELQEAKSRVWSRIFGSAAD